MDYRVVTYLSILLAVALCSHHEDWSSTCPCPRIYQPVCGSDKRTYNSHCEFQCRQKEHEELKVMRLGRCDGSE